jgi:integrase
MKTTVALRQRPISKHRISLYLDYYPAIVDAKTGKETRREYLKMYLFEDKEELQKDARQIKKEIKDLKELQTIETYAAKLKRKEKELQNIKTRMQGLSQLSPIDKQQNIETYEIAKQIRNQRQNEQSKKEIYTDFEKEQMRLKELQEQCFVDYFQKLAEKKEGSNSENWKAAFHYLNDYTNGKIKFSELSETFFEEYKESLLHAPSRRDKTKIISQNTALSYFNKIKAALKKAFREGYLTNDMSARISPIKPRETQRMYLSIEELNKLIKTACNDEILKRAGLFSALTGLRFSDIEKLTWGEVEHFENHGYFIKYRQKKTTSVETLPISEQAYKLLGSPGEPTEKVFPKLTYDNSTNNNLRQWVKDAGIHKDITFHCFRHTYATLQLMQGTDIFTVSKMLGHKDLKTTLIYAKIADEAKFKAANRIKLEL